MKLSSTLEDPGILVGAFWGQRERIHTHTVSKQYKPYSLFSQILRGANGAHSNFGNMNHGKFLWAQRNHDGAGWENKIQFSTDFRTNPIPLNGLETLLKSIWK